MKFRHFTLAALLIISLAGCGGGESLNDIEEKQEPAVPFTRIEFDPANSVVPLPSDLLLLTTTDGTLDIPVDDPNDLTDPAVALSALDGWGTSMPININVTFPSESFGQYSLDPSSLAQPGAVHLLEVVLGNPVSPDPDCRSVNTGLFCKYVGTLSYGTDYVTSSDGSSITIVPIRPLKPSTSYLIATTSMIQDSEARPVHPSTSYELLKQDVVTAPLGTESQIALQAAVNSYEAALEMAGIDSASVTYSSPFSTQSVVDVMAVARLVVAQAQSTLDDIADTNLNVAQVLASRGTVLTGDALAAANSAMVYTATINLPMMQDVATLDNCSVSDLLATGLCSALFTHWEAAGDSPVKIAGALESGELTQASFAAQALAQNPDLTSADLANPARWVGLNISVPDANGIPLDEERHLTRFNPLPKVKAVQQANVLITVPDPDMVNAIRAQAAGIPVESLPDDGALVRPITGWPVAIYGHGAGWTKETVLGVAGTLAFNGIATISIDLPMHGERSVDLNQDGIYELTATSPQFGAAFANGNIMAYLNLSSLLSVRDAMRQSSLDFLTLRSAITFTALRDAAMMEMPLLDASDVSFIGTSQGAVTGTPALAVANLPVVLPDGSEQPNPFTIKAAILNAPTGGYAASVAFSNTFGPIVEAGLTESESFQGIVQTTFNMNAEQIMALQQTAPEQYQAMVDGVYPAFLNQFLFAAQQVLDSADPINFASQLTSVQLPILSYEMVGNGADNLSDQVLPNSTAEQGWPVAGTEALFSAMQLQGVGATKQEQVSFSSAIRVMYGHHSSMVSPDVVEGVAIDVDRNVAVTEMMQSQVAEYLNSGGMSVSFTEEQAALVAPAG